MSDEKPTPDDASIPASTPASGSRWEPDAETQAQPVDPPAEAAAVPPAGQPPRPRTGWRTSVSRNRAGLVGAAALLLVVSAGGGFAVGRATGGGHDGHRDLSSDHRGFDGSVPGGDRGQLPPPGAPQGPDDLQGQEDG
ncbi:hypothetical protein FB382_003716 [Nocardioides ginsengisegetis]|uniref:Uncharacterized protein n=1 Tax=Nocardioides ginsengisegetis TaxID=661491 RepID=A0A7W3PB42_9ACTN|nr:hypothetical protein [Nocardioides ginsengisegetis]MBA8805425.1 hypothetical protein [Nocardioides ginsengisegetis]